MIEVQIRIIEEKESIEIGFDILKREDASEKEKELSEILEKIYKGVILEITKKNNIEVETKEIK